MWEVVPRSTGRSIKKGDREGGVTKQVITVGTRAQSCWGTLGARVEHAPQCVHPVITRPGGQEWGYSSVTDSGDMLILQHSRFAAGWQSR